MRSCGSVIIGGAWLLVGSGGLSLPGCGSDGQPAGPNDSQAPRVVERVDELPEDGEAALGPDAAIPRAELDAAADELDAALEADGGALDDARDASLADATVTPDPFASPPACTSKTFWFNERSARMHPGRACIHCHVEGIGIGRAPHFVVAGTVYPTAHEPDECNAAVPAGVHVEITDAAGKKHELQVNDVGNFTSLGPIAFPYTARVIAGGRVRAMKTPQRSGDCNQCHTQGGSNAAPGRVLLP